MSEPSSYGLSQAISVLMQARERLLADEDLAGDQDLLADWLASDPATCSEWEYLPRLVRAIIALEGQAKLAKERAAEIKARADRFDHRAKALRETLKAAMEMLNLPRLPPAPDFSASIGKGRRKVHADVNQLPDKYVRTKREPMLVEIGDALSRGEDVPGAELGNAEPILIIRRT